MKIKIAFLIAGMLFITVGSVVRADDALPTPISAETVLIRNGDSVIYQGVFDLPVSGTIDILDDTGANHSINADSVLGLIYAIGQSTGTFSISDLQYYDSYGSFYLKCITPSGGIKLCDNWQYAVGGSTPWSGIDSSILSGGETVGLYFGSPHQVIFNATSVTTPGTVTATAQKYNYQDNTWSSLIGVTIGATVPNPDDLYNPIVIASQAVDGSGVARFALADPGTYNVGIAEDYYFPSYPVIASTTGTRSGASTPPPAPPVFSIAKALTFLSSVQSPNGSFGSDMYTDWAAIGVAATPNSVGIRANILQYMASHAAVSSLLTDNERHAMALLALGQNPYSFSGTDYIAPIVRSFDGKQFGDSSLVNDDIFALITLGSAGYSASDEIIAKDIAFILSKQNASGSWDGSIDMTAAAVQALHPFAMETSVSGALANASLYLQGAQVSDGGFGSIYSTSWVAQAMNAFKATWTKNDRTVANYLSKQQAEDGAALPYSEIVQNRIWATSYAIPAVLGKPWTEIFHGVSKPVNYDPISIPIPVSQRASLFVPDTAVIVPVLVPDFSTPVLVSSVSDPVAASSQILATESATVAEQVADAVPDFSAAAGDSRSGVSVEFAVGSVIALIALVALSRYLLPRL